jgi:AAA domain
MELNRRTVVVVDEAGMVGTRQLAQLIDHCAAGRAKLVLVGDLYQLPAIEAGGLFHGLVNRLPAVELTENRRQHAAWERAALDERRNGDPSSAIDAYNKRGRIVTADNAEVLRDRLVGDWWLTRTEHGADGALMIAARRSDVDDLNARARVRMKAAGCLAGPEMTVDDRSFQAGDEVVCLRNDRRLGALNGTRGTVTSYVDVGQRMLTLSTTGGSSITVPATYLDAGHITHGYAITGHKSQGMTSNHVFVLGSDTIIASGATSRCRAGAELTGCTPSARASMSERHTNLRRGPGQRAGSCVVPVCCVARRACPSLWNTAISRSPRSPATPGHTTPGLRPTRACTGALCGGTGLIEWCCQSADPAVAQHRPAPRNSRSGHGELRVASPRLRVTAVGNGVRFGADAMDRCQAEGCSGST